MKFEDRYSLLVLLIFLSLRISAQNLDYSFLTIPVELQKDANHVVRLDYTKLEVSSKKQATMHVKYVVTLLNGKSKLNKHCVFYDNDKKINDLSAKIYDSFGNLVKKYFKNDFNDQSAIDHSTMYSDNRIKCIDLVHNNYPYTIEIEYKKTFKDILYYPNCNIQGFNSSLENLIFIVETPSELEIKYKARNIEIEPEINNSGKKIIYTWSVKNRPSIISEEFAPSSEQILPFIEITPRYFQYNQYVGDAATWETFGSFFQELRQGRDNLSLEMSKTVQSITSGLDSNKEKIDTLYRYLQENMRYVSVQLEIGGYQPFDAKYVEKNKYGDCKALSNFMLSMLKEAGIESQPGIIFRDGNRRMNVDENFPTLFGNHMLLYVPSEDIWLECTSNDYPPNYLGESNDNRSVLLLTENGGKLVKSPEFKIPDNTQNSKTKINISPDGSAHISGTVKTSGPKHEIYRYIENNLSKTKFEEFFLSTSSLPAFNIEKLEVKSQKENPEAQLDFDLIVKRFASKAGKRLFVPINKLNVFDQVPSPTENRVHPIEVLRGYQEKDKTVFQLPDGYEVESIPQKEMLIQTDYGKYSTKIEIVGSTLTYHRFLEIQPVNLPPEEFDQFRNFYKEIAKADNMKIVLVKKS